jgi:hypothetical protein
MFVAPVLCQQRKFGNGIGLFKQSFFSASNQNAHSRRERNAQHFAGIDPVLVVDADDLGLSSSASAMASASPLLPRGMAVLSGRHQRFAD